MNIKDAAEHSGLPAKTIRYYEQIGLIAPLRAENGYRRFCDQDVHNLTFIARARSLGFSVEDCRALLALYADTSRASADVKALAAARLEDIDAKLASLNAMRATLAGLMEFCSGDDRPDCPILSNFSAG